MSTELTDFTTGSNLCVVIGRTRHKMIQIEIQEAAKRGARLLEVRLDFLAKAPDFKRLLADKPCALIATVRRPEDGGRWSGTEDARKVLLRQAIVAGFDWVDVETDIADEIRRFGKVKRIVSYHNMHETPEDLSAIHQRMCEQDPDVVKIAVRAQKPADNLRVLDLLKGSRKPTAALCMGDLGMPSRLLGPLFGAPFTYAAFNKERGIAPGLPSFDDMRKIYHYEELNADTQIYGVIGDPVGHSLSPLIHNAALREVGRNAVYLPFRVPRGELAAFLKDFDHLQVRGYSVTIPHKEAAAAIARHSDSPVQLTKAANTLLRQEDGWAAYNTDYQAAMDSLLNNLPPSWPKGPEALQSRNVMILGAGGVARSIAHAAHQAGAAVTLINRTAERAQKLATEVGCRHADWGARHTLLCDLLINCTSVGMHPKVDELPIHASYLKPTMMVMETVYTPETTLLVKEARKRECHVLTGVDFFLRQAALQFQLFTGQVPPLQLMRQVIQNALSPVTIREEA